MEVIYEPKGRAREFGELAANLYTGCDHGCKYCYCPMVLHKSRKEFQRVQVRPKVLERLEEDGAVMETLQDRRPVFLCFACDPYPQAEADFHVTREAIRILHRHQVPVRILTKGGLRATRDFQELGPEDEFGVTLTFSYRPDSAWWEPGAAEPWERVESLSIARNRGMRTWVSLEPVIDPKQTLRLIDLTYRFVDRYAVGVLNYAGHLDETARGRLRPIDLRSFCADVEDRLHAYGKAYLSSR